MYLTSLVIFTLFPVETSPEWVEIRLHPPAIHKVEQIVVDRPVYNNPKQSEKIMTALEVKKVDIDSEKASEIEDTINEEVPHTSRPPDNKKFDNVLKLITLVANTVSKHINHKHTDIHTKLDYLRHLQRSLLYDVEQRIEATWPDDPDIVNTGNTSSRKARAASEGRGHVDFPSSESALMTISFLTFAVFLIKLVLQVIQTYKNKAMMMAPAVLAFSKSVEVAPPI